MKYRPIRTQGQYGFVAKRMEQLKDAAPCTPEAAELKRLAEMIVEYEVRAAACGDNPPEQPGTGSQR